MVHIVRKISVSREWWESYCNLLKNVIHKYNLDFQNESFVYLFTNYGYISMIICDRKVFKFSPKELISLILPLDFNSDSFPDEIVVDKYTLQQNQQPDALFISFQKKNSLSFHPEIIRLWEQCIELQVAKKYKSKVKKLSKLSVYKFIVDDEFRNTVLNRL